MQAADAEAEMELQPETAGFRKALLMRWQALFDTEPDLGELRAFLSTLLTHAPVAAVVRFVANNREWGQGEHRLLLSAEAGAELIQCVYPRPTWSKMPALAKDGAADHQVWSRWIREWSAELSSTGPAAAVAVLGRRETWADFLCMKGAAMFDIKDAVLGALSISQVALDVYMAVEKNRKDSVVGETAQPRMTIEAVMTEAQCHIPRLKDALVAFMGDREQISHCVDVVLENPDLLSLLNRLSGLQSTPSRPPTPASRVQPAAEAAVHASAPPVPPPATAQPDAELAPPRTMMRTEASPGPRPAPPQFRAEFLPRVKTNGPSGAWVAALSATRASPVMPAAEPEAASGRDRVDPSGAPVRDVPPAAPVADATNPTTDPLVEQALARLENLVHEHSRAIRERGDRLLARMDALLAKSGSDRPPAEAPTATTRIEPTSANDEQVPDHGIKARIEQTERRIAQAHDRDDEFLTWLEERFEAIPPEVQCPQEGSSSAA